MDTRAGALFRALGDPTRLRILHLLRGGELCVGDLVAVLRVPQPTTSRHLTALKRVGLVTARKRSYWTFYALAAPRTALHHRVLDCLEADADGQRRDRKQLAAVRRQGGCCPL